MGGLQDVSRDIPENKTNIYFLMQNMLTGSMLAMIYTNDIFTAFVFIEIIIISACSIVSSKPGGRTLVATTIYFIMSLIGSCLILLAIAMLYGVTGHLLMPSVQKSLSILVAAGEYTIPLFVLTGLFVAGLGIKSAMFPFHGWLPGAHASATSPASAVLSGIIIKCYPILLVKLIYRVYTLETMELLQIPIFLIVLSLTGIVYGSWKAARQQNIKRMLSYASIANMGYIFAAIGLNTERAMAAACFHITVHAIGKAMLFTAAGALAATSGGRNDYDSLLGAARRDPFSGAAFIIGGLTMIGIPPFPGFASKLYFVTAALETPYAVPVLLVAVLISTILSAMYFFPVIFRILAKHDETRVSLPVSHSLPGKASLAAFLILLLYLGLFSSSVIRVIEQGLAVLG
jgi:multicomponent Na+:H+ antiporter subunit D